MKLEGLEWAGAASKAALARMWADMPGATPEEPKTAPRYQIKRSRPFRDALRRRAVSAFLVLIGGFSLAVAYALLVALFLEVK